MQYPRAMRFSSLLTVAALAALTSVTGCGSTTNPPGNDAAPTPDAGFDAFVPPMVDGGNDAAMAPDTHLVDAFTTGDADLPDAGPCVASGACDPFDPTSCGTMACRPSATGTMCAAIGATPVGIGHSCLRDSDCEAGLACLNFSVAEGALCHRMCPAHSVGACDTGYVCTGTFGDTCINACRPLPVACDIYAQDCPNATDTCTLVRNAETTVPYTGCRPAGTQDEGMPCGGSAGSCGHALICVATPGAPATCRQVCDPTRTPTLCLGTEVCTGLATTWGVHYCLAP